MKTLKILAIVCFGLSGIVFLTRVAIYGFDAGCVSYWLGYISWGSWIWFDLAMGALMFPVFEIIGYLKYRKLP